MLAPTGAVSGCRYSDHDHYTGSGAGTRLWREASKRRESFDVVRGVGADGLCLRRAGF